MTETYHHKGYDIPVDLMRMTGGGPETFEIISEQHIAHIQRHVGIAPSHSIVEIGCGIGRDAIPLGDILGSDGAYLGIDIIKPSIDWCTGNITKRHANFRFTHYDVADQLHNPGGTLAISDCVIPLPSQSVDLIVLQSVFTHMFEEGIGFYLREFARVLKPTGRVYATCFIIDDKIREMLHDKPVTIFDLSFRHAHGEGCFINDPVHPTGAVAFTQQKLEAMVLKAGLEPVKPTLPGAWSGAFPQSDCGQDVAILGRRKQSMLQQLTSFFR